MTNGGSPNQATAGRLIVPIRADLLQGESCRKSLGADCDGQYREEIAYHSIRKACTGSMEAARRAGMMPAMAAATTRTPIAIAMTGTLTLVIS